MHEQFSSERVGLKEEAAAAMSTQADAAQGHALWTAFAEATTVEAFCRNWLALQCPQINGRNVER
jgi:hypothetical protein